MNTAPNRPFRWLYLAALTLVVLSGFGQMPIFKRFYLADLPGFGWTGEFYADLLVHYLASAGLLLALGYLGVDYFLTQRRRLRLTGSGLVRSALLAVALGSGVMMMIKNFPGVRFPQNFLITLDLIHLSATMVFLLASLAAVLLRQKWVREVGS
jgi:hypothetical protein